MAVVRVHADRVHDVVRRLGCTPDNAVDIVENSALDLVDALRGEPETVPDLVGWWFARARQLARPAADAAPDLPLGGGLLAADEVQEQLAEALEQLPERDRVALLMRDSYALPAISVATALATDPDGVLALVGAARRALLPDLEEELPPSLVGHAVDQAALARLAEGPPVAARDATTRRHAQSCALCSAVVAAEERMHLLLAGLTVVALLDADREDLLARVEAHARASLVPAASLQAGEPEEDEEEFPRRILSPLLAFFGVLLAVIIGVVVGIALNHGSAGPHVLPVSPGPLPVPSQVTLTANPSAGPTGTARATPSTATTVFTVPPATSGPPSPTRTSAPAVEPLSLSVSPSSGPNGSEVTVSGTGWTPGRPVRIDYLDRLGQSTGSGVTITADARGRFTTPLSTVDPTNIPGAHTVRATNGTQTKSATYTAN